MAVLDLEAAFGHQVVVEIAALIVVNAERLLLDHGIVTDRIHLQAGGQRNRPERAMGRHGDVVGLRHMADPDHFRNAADMGSIGIDDAGGALFEDGPEIVAAVQPLTDNKRNRS
ncbi:hypothetical protein D9M72_625270 [compost metagenome]